MRDIILKSLEKLSEIDYLDSAEHLYDAIKQIKRHLDDDNLDYHIDDFLWGLESSTVIDMSYNGDEIGKISKFIRESRVSYKRDQKLNDLGI